MADVLIFLRHGRTPNNADARLQGQLDSPLDEVGREQARRAGAAIGQRWKVDRVITSSLRRTIETAEEASLSDLPSTIDDRWMEIDFGAYDDRRIGEVMNTLGAEWAKDIEFVPEGGESIGNMHRRVGLALDDLLPHDPDENVVIVTHATPIKSVMTWVLGGEAEMILRSWVNLGSVTTFTGGPHGLLLSEFNWRPDATP